MKAWLVTWVGSDEHVDRDGEVASILSPFLTPETVRKHVERHYADACYSLSEKLDAARSGQNKCVPFPAEFNYRIITINGMPARQSLGHITCGPNPHLFARKVTDLEVREDKDGNESLYWAELPIPEPPGQ